MNQTQKIIKYLAIAFAVFLIITIFTTAIQVLNIISSAFSDEPNISEKLENLDINDNFKKLDIDIRTTRLTIKSGDELKAETNNQDIKVSKTNDKLFIEETGFNLFNTKQNSELIIYVPSDLVFDAISIESGAGKIAISELKTNILNLDLGAGDVTIDKIIVNDNTTIDGGVGKLTIASGILSNLDLDIGIGEVSINSQLIGKSDIDAGIGKTTLNLIGTNEDYRIEVEKGLGSATIAGEKISSEKTYGDGNNKIEIDGGIGSIDIEFIPE